MRCSAWLADPDISQYFKINFSVPLNLVFRMPARLMQLCSTKREKIPTPFGVLVREYRPESRQQLNRLREISDHINEKPYMNWTMRVEAFPSAKVFNAVLHPISEDTTYRQHYGQNESPQCASAD
jgi:hypothetical protein